jgi:hypothetical protein
MAKQAAKKPAAKTVEAQTEILETPVAEVKKSKPKKPEWEIKDRHYFLSGNKMPLTFTLPSRHTRKYPLLWFDENNGVQKEIRYATNQNSVFVDEQKGECTLGHIMFKNGHLHVPKERQQLQKLLSLYHPHKGHKYTEKDEVLEATNELDWIEAEIDALMAARDMEVDQAEAILRVELGSKVSSMSSKEIKRDLLIFAKRNPILFIELANDDNVQLRNFGIKAAELGLIKLSQDQRTFTWGATNRKLMTVPFDENPYSAFAAFLKTDEGVEVYRSIEKKLI